MNCGECGNVTAPGAGFPNHVYCKRFLLHMEKKEDASRCRYFIPTPITNADRFRAMTDEELAKTFADYISCHSCPIPYCEVRFTMERLGCQANWRDWLRQEAGQCTK